MPQDIFANFDGCGKRFSIKHALSCPKGGLVLAWYDDAAKEWGALGAWALVPSAITYEPKLISMAVQGESTESGARQDGRTAEGSTDIVGEYQWGCGTGRTVNRADVLGRRPGQVASCPSSPLMWFPGLLRCY